MCFDCFAGVFAELTPGTLPPPLSLSDHEVRSRRPPPCLRLLSLRTPENAWCCSSTPMARWPVQVPSVGDGYKFLLTSRDVPW